METAEGTRKRRETNMGTRVISTNSPESERQSSRQGKYQTKGIFEKFSIADFTASSL